MIDKTKQFIDNIKLKIVVKLGGSIMLEILKYVFSDFWIWLGTVILLGVTLDGMANIIGNIKKK